MPLTLTSPMTANVASAMAKRFIAASPHRAASGHGIVKWIFAAASPLRPSQLVLHHSLSDRHIYRARVCCGIPIFPRAPALTNHRDARAEHANAIKAQLHYPSGKRSVNTHARHSFSKDGRSCGAIICLSASRPMESSPL